VDSASNNPDVIGDFEKRFTGKLNISFIYLKDNLGYGHACNIGAKELKECKYIVFLNNDVILEEGWLFPLVEEVEKDTSVAVVQPKILNRINKQLFDYAGGAGGFMDYFFYPFCRGRILFKVEKDNNQYDLKTDICWASGACMLVSRKVFEDMAGFDENYFMYVEENDLCLRIWNYGKRVRFIPDSRVYHEGCLTVSA